MFLLTLVLTLVISLSVISAADSVQETSLNEGKKHNLHRVFNTYIMPLSKTNHSRMYFDDRENMLRLPDMKKTYENKNKKKTLKKSPKRTIQKIIKKNKKSKKLYMNQMTTEPAKALENVEPYDFIQEEQPQKNDAQTTQATQRKKGRKWGNKRSKYQMPFHKLQSRKDVNTHRRNRRDTGRDLFILQDLDEMEFLSHEDGEDVVIAHVKNYW